MKNTKLWFIAVFWLLPALMVDVMAAEKLPQGIKWLSNDSAPLFASPHAKKGGTFRAYFTSFPMTIRVVGPDSNTGLYTELIYNDLSLVNTHPNTGEILPELATHWAFGDDHKTMYFKLDKRARWSDGKPVKADDYLFTLEFMRSKNIVAPFYNNYYTNEIDRVIKYSEDTIAVVSKKALPDLHLRVPIGPTPRHFYGKIPKDFVKRYNWKVVPNTGPYQISKIKKGKSVTFKRNKNWWAKDLRYFKGRFNVDKVIYTVIREDKSAFEYFKKGRLDSYDLSNPEYWHEKAKNLDIHQKGYVKKMWAYVNKPKPSSGLWLNQDKEIFKSKKVRHAFAHALNIEKILKVVYRGDFDRLNSGSEGYGKYTNEKIKARKFNIKRVENLMTSEGWKRGSDGIWVKKGQRFSVKVLYGYKDNDKWLVVLKEDAKKAGVELVLQLMDGATMLKMADEKRYQVVAITISSVSSANSPRYWSQYHSSNAHTPQNNMTNTDDPELDRLIETYRKTFEIKKRIALARKIQEKVHEIGAFVPILKKDYLRWICWRWLQFPEVPVTKKDSRRWRSEVMQNGLFWIDPIIKKETLAAVKSRKTFRPETLVDKTFKAE
jgi:microcin C transport system substrate-binding protein